MNIVCSKQRHVIMLPGKLCSLVILKFFTLVSSHIIVEHMDSEQLTPNKEDIIQGDYAGHTIYVNRYCKQVCHFHMTLIQMYVMVYHGNFVIAFAV